MTNENSVSDVNNTNPSQDATLQLLDTPFAKIAQRYVPELKHQPAEQPFVSDVTGTIADLGRAALSGVTGAIEDLGETATSIADWTIDGGLSFLLGRKVDLFDDNPDYHNMLTPDGLVPQTKVGAVAREFMKFGVKIWALNIVNADLVSSYPNALKLLTGSKMLSPEAAAVPTELAMELPALTASQQITQGTVKGVVTGALADFTRHPEETLIDPDNPLLNAPWYKDGLAGLLNSNPDDPQYLKRLRFMTAGVLPNAAFSFITSGLSAAWKLHKAKTAAERAAANEAVQKQLDSLIQKQNAAGNVEQVTKDTIKNFADNVDDGLKIKRGTTYTPSTRLNPKTFNEPTASTISPLDKAVRALEEGSGAKFDDETIKRISSAAAKAKAESMILTDTNPSIRALLEQLGVEGKEGGLNLTTSMLNLADVIQNEVTPNVIRAYHVLDDAITSGLDTTAAYTDFLNQLTDLVYGQYQLTDVKHWAGVSLRAAGKLSKNFKSNVDLSAFKSGDWTKDSLRDVLGKNMTVKMAQDLGAAFAGAQNVYHDGRAVAWITNLAKNVITDQKPMGFWDMMKDLERHYTYFSMLSGPRTQVGNIVGNTIKVFVTDPMDLYFSRLHSSNWDFGQAWDDTAAYFGGLRKGFKLGTKVFRSAMKYGTSILAPEEGLKADYYNPALGNSTNQTWLKKILRIPGDLLNGADEVFKQAAYRGNVDLQIHDFMKTAQAKTILGPNADASTLAKFKEAIVDKFYGSIMVDNRLAVSGATSTGFKDATTILDANKALQAALTSTWNNTPQNNSLFNVMKWLNHSPIGHHLMPFTKTVFNIGKDALADHNPLWQLRLLMDPAIKSNPELYSKVVGHFATSVILYSSAYMLYESGLITGGGPSNKTAKQVWREQGNIPYSIKTPMGWIGIGNLDPVAAPLIMLSDTFDKLKEIDPSTGQQKNSLVASAFNALADYATNRTWLKSVGDIMDALESKDVMSGIGRYIRNNFAGSYIPSVFATTRQMIDPYTRETRDTDAPFTNRLPFWSDEVTPPKVSWLTGELVNSVYGDNALERVFSAASFQFKELRDEPDVVMANLIKSNGNHQPSRTLSNDVALNDEDYAKFCYIMGTIKLNGQTLYKRLEQQFKSPYWEKSYGIDPNEYSLSKPKEKWITTQINRYKKAAEKEFLRQNPNANLYARERVRQKQEYKKGRVQSVTLEPYDSNTDYSNISNVFK